MSLHEKCPDAEFFMIRVGYTTMLLLILIPVGIVLTLTPSFIKLTRDVLKIQTASIDKIFEQYTYFLNISN